MHIKKLKIENYKSFGDSGWIDFSEGFNIVVGKNSSGKTALLEALRLTRASPRPHLSISRSRGEPLDPQSKFLVEAVLSGDELRKGILNQDAYFPVPSGVDARKFIEDALGSNQTFSMTVGAGQSIHSTKYPSHGLFQEGRQAWSAHVRPQPDKQSYIVVNVLADRNDSLAALFKFTTDHKLYVFKAERLNIGEIAFGEQSVLAEDAGNLPRVLQWLMTNPTKFERYNRHVNQIFPYIKRVSVFPKGNNLEIRLWWVDVDTEREDLAVPLQESGTGVSQVLGILFVVMTIDKGTIVIDEPNTFLHPGAAKTLIEILAQYKHQYIISTHSPEIITAANPAALFIVRWSGGDSTVERVERVTMLEQREILSELGVSASDVFGADQIVWVEGATEAECFPLVAQRALGTLPTSIDFLAVRSVDEVVRKQRADELILDIYRRLSETNALLPRPIHFSFDREKRSEQYISKIAAETKGTVRFLPRRCYECFLLNFEAIAAVLTREANELGNEPISKDAVKDWFAQHNAGYGAVGDFDSSDVNGQWFKTVDAPALLTDIFYELVKIEFSKTRHSRALTEWLLDHQPEHLKDLSEYVKMLLKD
jgi:hypothetical protein